MTAFASATPVGPYPATVAALALNIAGVAMSAGTDTFKPTGRELLEIENTGAGAHTFTLTTVTDPQGRTNDVTAYSLGAGLKAYFWFGATSGWKDGSGNVSLTGSNAELVATIIKIPQT